MGFPVAISMGLLRILMGVVSILLALPGFLFFGPVLGIPLMGVGVYLLYQEFAERGKKTQVAPPGTPPPPPPPNCPTCGRPLTYVAQYQRWYCQYEQKYY